MRSLESERARVRSAVEWNCVVRFQVRQLLAMVDGLGPEARALLESVLAGVRRAPCMSCAARENTRNRETRLMTALPETERKVISALSGGGAVIHVAAMVGIAPEDVRQMLRRTCRLVGAPNRTALIAMAARAGITG